MNFLDGLINEAKKKKQQFQAAASGAVHNVENVAQNVGHVAQADIVHPAQNIVHTVTQAPQTFHAPAMPSFTMPKIQNFNVSQNSHLNMPSAPHNPMANFAAIRPHPQPNLLQKVNNGIHTVTNDLSKGYDQLNTLDGNRTWKQRTPTAPNQSVMQQAGHIENGLEDQFVKPLARIAPNATIIANNLIAKGLHQPKLQVSAQQVANMKGNNVGHLVKTTGATGTNQQFAGDLAQGALNLATDGIGGAIDKSFANVAAKAAPKLVGQATEKVALKGLPGTALKGSSKIVTKNVSKAPLRVVANAGTGATVGMPYGVASLASSGAPMNKDSIKQAAISGGQAGAVLGGGTTAAAELAPVAVKAGVKGTKAAAYKASTIDIKKPTSLSNAHLNAMTKVMDAHNGNASPFDISDRENHLFNDAQKKLGAKPGTPEGIMAVDQALKAHNAYDTKLLQRDALVNTINDRIKSMHSSGSGTKYFLRQDGKPTELMTTHNLSEDNLAHAERMGGIPQASIGIVDPRKHAIDGYGDITLVGNEKLVDPKAPKTNTYASDVYSPRQPRADVRVSSTQPILAKLSKEISDTGEQTYNIERGDIVNTLADSPATKAHYLKENGVKPDLSAKGDRWQLRLNLDKQMEAAGLHNGYNDFVNKMIMDNGGERTLFAGFTPSGNRRQLPETMDNVLKLMRKEGQRGGEDMGGIGNMRSHITPKFKSLAEIVKNKDKLTDTETMDAVKETLESKLQAVQSKLEKHAVNKSDNQFTEYDSQMSAIRDYLSGDTQYFRQKFPDAPAPAIKAVEDFKTELQHAPTEYFESVSDRAVKLNEFEKALVPENASPATIDHLRANGVEPIVYKEGQRQAMLNKLMDEDNAKRFPTETDPKVAYESAVRTMASKQASITKQLKAGTITQAEADASLAPLKANVKDLYSQMTEAKLKRGNAADTAITSQEMQSIIDTHRKRFGDENIKVGDTGSSSVLGHYKYHDDMITLADGKSDVLDTVDHESIHKAIGQFLPDHEIEQLYKDIVTLKGGKSALTKQYRTNGYRNISWQGAAEEEIANTFIDFLKARKVSEGSGRAFNVAYWLNQHGLPKSIGDTLYQLALRIDDHFRGKRVDAAGRLEDFYKKVEGGSFNGAERRTSEFKPNISPVQKVRNAADTAASFTSFMTHAIADEHRGAKLKIDRRAYADDLSPEQNQFIAQYAEMLKDQGQGNGVAIHPDGRRLTNNNRAASLGSGNITNTQWFDQARADLESGKGAYGASDEYKALSAEPAPLDVPAGFEAPKAPVTKPAVSLPKAAKSAAQSKIEALPKGPTKINVKGAMTDADYKARFGKDKAPVTVKVAPFTKPELDFKKWNDKNALGLGRETMERNLDRVAGKDAEKVKHLLVDSSRDNETARTVFANDLRKNTRQVVVKDLGIKMGSHESALTQKLGEGLLTKEDIIKEVGQAKADRIAKASDYFRKQYDTLIDQWNVTRKKYGYDSIPKRKDYFRHFQAIQQNAGILGTIKNARDLPTEISGITDIFSPNKPFSDAALQRKGNKTTFDAVGGFDNYINSVSRQIFHTDTVQKGRAIEGAIRKQAAKDPSLELPNLVANLHEWTNLVSGKKTRIDRAAEELVGRKVYAASNAIRSKTGANMIGANIGSAMTNFIPFTQALATTGKIAMTKAIKDTAASPFTKSFHAIDGQTSSFLTRRFPDEAISFNKLQKASQTASLPFKVVDTFTSRTIVAGKYFENKAKGMSPQAAMKAADDYASRVITDRSVGQMPNLMETKTAGFLAQFQAEVNNQVSFLSRDIPQFANGNKLKIASSLAQFALYSYLANEAYQKVLGRRVQLDPIHAAAVIGNPKSNNRQRLDAAKNDIAGGLPFTSLFTGGRLPVNAMLPDVASLAKGVGAIATDKNKAAREIYKGVSGPLFYGLPPFGGGQLKKTAEYAQNMMKGYSETPAGTKRFDIAKDPMNTIKGLAFGQYSTTPGKSYVNSITGGKKNDTTATTTDTSKVLAKLKATISDAKKSGDTSKLNAVDKLAVTKELNNKKLKATLSNEDYKLSRLSKKDRQKLIDNGSYTQAKFDGLDNYVYNQKKKLGIDTGTSKTASININTPADQKKFLTAYDNMSAAERKDAANQQNDFNYKYLAAKYANDKANNKLSAAQDVNAQEAVLKAKVGKDYPKNVRDLWGLNKTELSVYLSAKEDGKDKAQMAKDIIAYDDALTKSGVQSKNKFRLKDGSVAIAPAKKGSGSKGGKGGSKKNKGTGLSPSDFKLPTDIISSNTKGAQLARSATLKGNKKMSARTVSYRKPALLSNTLKKKA